MRASSHVFAEPTTSTLRRRPTVATVDLGALEQNLRSCRTFIGESVKVMAVVKADAYGHGAVECAKRLSDAGAEWLAVALVEEGIELRSAGITGPILCLGGFWPGQTDDLLDHDLVPTIFDIEAATELNKACEARSRFADVHIKIDTGMGRVGVPFSETHAFLDKFRRLKNLRVQGMMTHFAAADDLGENEFTRLQIRRLDESVSAFSNAGLKPEIIDLANSPAAVAHRNARSQMVRLGGILYGLEGDVLPKGIPRPELQPVMSLTTEIGQLKSVPAGESIGYGRTFRTKRDSQIATIGIGYHDGLPRVLSNYGSAIVRGVRAPIVGRISMDWTILDVTDISDVRRGDKVTLIGRDGAELILAEDLGALAGTISYEITCGIGRRVSREFVQ